MSSATELAAWLNGFVDGGPNGDGRYPLTFADGLVYLVLCPAAQALDPEAGTAPVEAFAAAAAASANIAATEADEAAASSLVAATQAANASSYATAANSSKVAAASSATAAAGSATTASSDASTATTQATAAGNSATAAAGSATTATQWASHPIGTVVSSGLFSARHYAQAAADSAAAAAGNSGGGAWGGITGTLTDQTDLQNVLNTKQASLGFTPYNITNPAGYTSNVGTVTGVTGTAPITSSGGAAPAISISAATTALPGSMSAADKTKLDGVATGAQVNAVTSVATRTGAVVLTKADVGLTNVNDTSDAAKPVSTAQAAADALKANIASPTFTGVPAAPTAAAATNTTQIATTAFVSTAVANLISSNPPSGGGVSWTTVAVNTSMADDNAYNVTGVRNMTLPASVATGKQFIIHAVDSTVTVVSNGNIIAGVGSGNNLTIAAGETAWLVGLSIGNLEIV